MADFAWGKAHGGGHVPSLTEEDRRKGRGVGGGFFHIKVASVEVEL